MDSEAEAPQHDGTRPELMSRDELIAAVKSAREGKQCPTCETTDRLKKEVERANETARQRGEMCHAIDPDGYKCEAPTEDGKLWCDFHCPAAAKP